MPNIRDEKLWAKAKSQAKKEGHEDDWAYVQAIYQSMRKPDIPVRAKVKTKRRTTS